VCPLCVAVRAEGCPTLSCFVRERSGVPDLSDLEMVTTAAALRHEQNHILKGVWKNQLLEDDQLDAFEAAHEETPDRGGILHSEKLCRKNETEPSLGTKESRRMDNERGPRTRKPVQVDPGPQRCAQSLCPSRTGELLVADERWISEDRVIGRRC